MAEEAIRSHASSNYDITDSDLVGHMTVEGMMAEDTQKKVKNGAKSSQSDDFDTCVLDEFMPTQYDLKKQGR